MNNKYFPTTKTNNKNDNVNSSCSKKKFFFSLNVKPRGGQNFVGAGI